MSELVPEVRERLRSGDYAKTADDVFPADDILALCDAVEALEWLVAADREFPPAPRGREQL